MILVGLEIEWLNCVGASKKQIVFFDADDIHEAAVETLKCNWSSGYQSSRILRGEFHDTKTEKTWSVDSGGHTKKDYRSETDLSFEKRWREGR